MEPILGVGEYSTDGDTALQLNRARYTTQMPDERWSQEAIEASLRVYMARAGIEITGRPLRTDVVYVSPDDRSAVVMSTFVDSGQRIFFGLEPTTPTIVVTAPERERTFDADQHETRNEAWVRNFVYGDMGENPNRQADGGLPTLGNGASYTFENEGITIRIPTGGGNLQYEHVPDSETGLMDRITDAANRTRESAEEEARRRSLGRGQNQ